ncbi:hypothetical protein BRC81_15220 [Halobacteriales archaeon QS_1_68_20]|nr:MAG: hypothetical protein BRC81_15220 [Halobacteriales archaeon QS_1_68_20]
MDVRRRGGDRSAPTAVSENRGQDRYVWVTTRDGAIHSVDPDDGSGRWRRPPETGRSTRRRTTRPDGSTRPTTSPRTVLRTTGGGSGRSTDRAVRRSGSSRRELHQLRPRHGRPGWRGPPGLSQPRIRVRERPPRQHRRRAVANEPPGGRRGERVRTHPGSIIQHARRRPAGGHARTRSVNRCRRLDVHARPEPVRHDRRADVTAGHLRRLRLPGDRRVRPGCCLAVRWNREVKRVVERSLTCSSPAVGGETVYVGDAGGTLHAFSP